MKPKTVGRASGKFPEAGHLAHTAPLSTGINAGAIVLTLDGELPVETLAPGDRLITRDAGMVRITALHRRRVTAPAVRLAAGSLGHTRPDRDVLLAGQQTVLIRDWRARALFGLDRALVPAQRLVDGEFITDLGPQPMMLFQILCDAPHVFYADGLEVGTADARAWINDAAAA